MFKVLIIVNWLIPDYQRAGLSRLCEKSIDFARAVWRWEHADVVEEMKKRMELEPWKVKVRKCIVEHPFGTMKRAFNQGYLLLKGLGKVAGEVGFTMLAYKMRRVLNILEQKAILALLI